jgi:potassium efflux system protein
MHAVNHVHGVRRMIPRLTSPGACAVVALVLWVLAAAAAAPRAAHAQAPRPQTSQPQAPQPPSPQPQTQTQAPQAPPRAAEAPAAIPIAEVTQQADEVAAFLRSLEEQLPPSQPVARIEQELAPMGERLTERFDQTRRTINSSPGLGTLDGLAESWTSSRNGLAAWMQALIERANWLERERAQLAKLAATWTLTRTAVREAKVPPQLSKRIEDVLAALAAAQTKVETQRVATLVLQDRVARELARADSALALIGQARQRAADSLFVRDSPPIWRLRPLRPLSAMPGALAASVEEQWVALRAFVEDRSDRIALHLAVVLALVGFIWWARGRARRLTTAEEAARSLAIVFDQPVASGVVLGMLSAFWIYADEPRTARLIAEIGAFAPMILILRRLVAPSMRTTLYAMGAFFVVDIVRDLVVPLSTLERVLFILEILAVAVLLGWCFWSGRIDDLVTARGASRAQVRKLLLKLALVGSLVALVAGAVGAVSLARLLGSGILSSGYLALVLIAGRRLAEGLVVFALRVPPLSRLRMVQHYGERFEQRATGLLRTIAALGWAIGTLDYFGALTPTIAAARRTLAASLTLGALNLSLGDVLAFGLTVYIAYLLSSVVQFVLAEDVFPRLNLRPGLPYALASLTKYAIGFVGFLLALLALGVNLDRVTVLGGAIGVGVGFGLQNIVNNFVSGLIVLFERPVRVGDAVQIGDVQGEVRRIGIRSTTVRSWEGAEVIVPNSQLVADRVTNWTPFDQRRRVEIRVSVAYGSAPDKVLQVLTEVAQGHPDVATTPPPLALFLGFGDSALQFQLFAWTSRLDRYGPVKSELGIAVYAAFREAGFTIPFPQQEIRIFQAPPPAP